MSWQTCNLKRCRSFFRSQTMHCLLMEIRHSLWHIVMVEGNYFLLSRALEKLSYTTKNRLDKFWKIWSVFFNFPENNNMDVDGWSDNQPFYVMCLVVLFLSVKFTKTQIHVFFKKRCRRHTSLSCKSITQKTLIRLIVNLWQTSLL